MADKTLIETTCRKFNTGLFLAHLANHSAVWLLTAGTIVLSLKVSGVHNHIPITWVLLTFLPLLMWTAARTGKEKYTPEQAAAWLDLKGQCGGHYLSGQTPGKEKPPPPTAIGVPKAQFNFPPLLIKLTLPIVFFIACLAIPPRQTTVTISPRAIHQRAAAVTSRIQKSSRLNLVESKKAAQFQEDIRQALINTESSPASTIEAVDHVQEKLDRSVFENTRAALDNLNKIGQLSAAASWAGPRDQKNKRITNALEKLANQLPPIDQLPPSLQKALKDFYSKLNNTEFPMNKWLPELLKKMDPQALKQLAEQMRQANLQALANANQFRRSGNIASQQIKQAMSKLGTAPGTHEAMTQFEQSMKKIPGLVPVRHGQGGINRGRGDAPLVLGKESILPAERFKPLTLKPGHLPLPGALLGNQKLAAQYIPPKEFQLTNFSRTNTNIKSTPGLHTTANNNPYHRRVIGKYFKKEKRRR